MIEDTNRRVLSDRRTGFDRRIGDRRRWPLLANPIPERRVGNLRTPGPRRRVVRRSGEHARLLARVRHRLYPTPLRPDPFDMLLADTTRQLVGRVLDIGAGRGGIRPRFTPGHVLLIGCDPTDAVSKNQTIDWGVQCDGGRLPFDDQSFDVCYMRYVIEHLRDPRRAFEEAYRVLRPSGRFVFVTPNAWYYASIAARVIPSRAHPRVVHWLTGRHESDVYPTFYAANTRARLRDQLHAVGFRERTLAFHQWGSGHGYIDFSVPTLLVDWAYERVVNSTPLLQAARRMIVGDFERPPQDEQRGRPSREMQETLHRCGFKRFVATEAAGYPGVEDYLGIDAAAGRLIHCHVHYRLIFGQPNIKSYRLPWEEQLLTSRRYDGSTGVYVPEPNLEMLVLLVRYAIKLRLRNVLGYLGGRNWLGELGAEYQWLRGRVDPDGVGRLCRELLGDEAAVALQDLLNASPTLLGMIRFRRVVVRRLALFRRHSVVTRVLRRWHSEVVALRAAIGRMRLDTTRPLRRTVPTGGVLIAFMGPGGSVKSAMARAAATLLAEKLDVLLIYFGSGHGPGSLLRWPLDMARAAAAWLGLLHG